jgi:hypothetical protein
MINAVRFGLSLVSALSAPISADVGGEQMRLHVAKRADHFLSLCDTEIFGKRGSPYQPLFRNAGYPREKLARLVRTAGLEQALSGLAADGICLGIKEFKGEKPVVRPGLEMSFDAAAADISAGPSIPLKSSGSRGPRMKTRIGVAGLRLLSTYLPLIMKGLGAQDLPALYGSGSGSRPE